MDEKDKSTTLHASYRVRAVTFLTIGIIIVTGIFVCTLIFNQNHTVMAQQQQALQQQVKQALTLKGNIF